MEHLANEIERREYNLASEANRFRSNMKAAGEEATKKAERAASMTDEQVGQHGFDSDWTSHYLKTAMEAKAECEKLCDELKLLRSVRSNQDALVPAAEVEARETQRATVESLKTQCRKLAQAPQTKKAAKDRETLSRLIETLKSDLRDMGYSNEQIAAFATEGAARRW